MYTSRNFTEQEVRSELYEIDYSEFQILIFNSELLAGQTPEMWLEMVGLHLFRIVT
jgi:hypothetical protein